MKTKHQFLIILMLLISYGLSAQLNVNSDGHVAVGDLSYDYYNFSVKGNVYVRDQITTSSSVICRGITPRWGSGTITIGGSLASYNSYTTTMKIDNDGEFAGYALEVNGDVKFNGGQSFTSSDRKFKKKIKKLNGSSILDRIQKLDAKEYKMKSEKELLDVQRSGLSTYKQDTLDLQEEALKMLESDMGKHLYYGKKVGKLNQKGIDSLIQIKYIRRVKKKYSILDSLDNNKIVVVDIPKMDTARINFGFMAQEVEPIFPNLVKMDSTTGMYAVNYMGFIPINYSAIKALKAENDELRAELDEIKSYLGLDNDKDKIKDKKVSTKSASVIQTQDTIQPDYQAAMIKQNYPNPYTESTTIDYYLPDNTINATIYIYDINGRQLKSYPLNSIGSSSLVISGGELYAGMFNYALVVDGVLIDSKRMIVAQ